MESYVKGKMPQIIFGSKRFIRSRDCWKNTVLYRNTVFNKSESVKYFV